MQHEFVLTPKELYFLGSIFRARYGPMRKRMTHWQM